MSAIGYLGAIPALVALIWSVLIFRKWPVALEEQGSTGEFCRVAASLTRPTGKAGSHQ
jgi:hypothetical protein